MKKQLTHKQILANYLRRKEYQGCHGQISSHGAGEYSIQIFAANTPENRSKFSNAELNPQGTLCVLDRSI